MPCSIAQPAVRAKCRAAKLPRYRTGRRRPLSPGRRLAEAVDEGVEHHAEPAACPGQRGRCVNPSTAARRRYSMSVASQSSGALIGLQRATVPLGISNQYRSSTGAG